MAKREQIDILFKMHADLQDMKRLQQETSKTRKQFQDIQTVMKNAFKPLAGAIGIASLTQGFKQLAFQAVDTASRIDDMARRLDVSTDLLQAWSFAGRENGLASEAAETALQRFTRRLGEAQKGQGVLLNFLKESNIALIDAEGRYRTTEDVLRDYANSMRDASTQNQRLAMASAAFDMEGTGMVTVLQGGAEALDDWIKKTREAGQMMDELTIKRLAAAENQIERLQTALTIAAGEAVATGFRFQFLADLAFFNVRGALANLNRELEFAKEGLDESGKAAGTSAGGFADFAQSVKEAEAAARAFDQLFERVAKVETDLANFGLSDSELLTNARQELEHLETVYANIAQGDEPNRTEARLKVMEAQLQVKQLEAKVDADQIKQWTEFENRSQKLDDRKEDFELKQKSVKEQQAILTAQILELDEQLAGKVGMDRLAIEEEILEKRMQLAGLAPQLEKLSFSRLNGPESLGEVFQDSGFGTFNTVGDNLVQGLKAGQSEMQILTGLADNFVTSLLSGLVQYAAQWVVTKTLVDTGILSTEMLMDSLRIQRQAKTAAEGATNAAALAPGAAAASISSFGAAPVIGIAALLAAMAAFGGFAEGGEVRGPGSGTSDSILARLSNGEFVMKAQAVQHYGVDYLAGLNAMRAPKTQRAELIRPIQNGLGGGKAGPVRVDSRTVILDHNNVNQLQDELERVKGDLRIIKRRSGMA